MRSTMAGETSSKGCSTVVWRKLEVAVLMRAFARAFDVEPPRTATLSAFRSFTAACMEAALADACVAERYRTRLGEEACCLGARVRSIPGVWIIGASRITRLLYRGIGIELHGDLPGSLEFCPCYFSERYTPADCWFMAAFDEGFMRGISGCEGANLVFRCRLTEGASRCCARFGSEERNTDG